MSGLGREQAARFSFLLGIPIITVAFIGGWFLVPKSRDPEETQFDPMGAVLSFVGIVSVSKPEVIVSNQPGAGSATMSNQLYASGPRDGTVIGAPFNGMPTMPLLQPESARFDAWLFRIAHNQAFSEMRRRRYTADIDAAQSVATSDLETLPQDREAPAATHLTASSASFCSTMRSRCARAC